MSQPLALSSSVHGAGCALGELLLSENELQKVNAAILSAGFRFAELTACEKVPVPIAAKQEPPSTRPRRQASTGKRKSVTSKASSVVDAAEREQAPPAKKKRTADPYRAPPPPPPPPVEPPAPRQEEYLPITEPLTVPARKGPIIFESADAFWTEAASQVLAKLEAHPMSVSFMAPVNPAAEGLEDYFERVKTPIDLQTIRQKLEGSMYSHPFRWQLDVRTIFFNAFTYHPEGHPVRRAAHELAVHFENLLKQEDAVNPYVVFKRPVIPKARPPTPPLNESIAESPANAPVPVAVPAPSHSELPPQVPVASPQIAPTAGEKITMDAAQLQALLVKAAASGVPTIGSSTGENPNIQSIPPTLPPTSASPAAAHPVASAAGSRVGVPGGSGGSGARNARAKAKAGRERELPPGVITKDGAGIIYTADCAKTKLGIELLANEPYSALPSPCPVPPTDNKNLPPMLSVGQKRTALARFKELDVVYRRAVLDLVKDELGIHSSLCAQELRYIPDVDVLPPIKQRQFFLYLKALVNQQKQAQDELHLPATLPRILNWNLGNNAAPLEIPTPVTPAQTRTDRGSPDMLPWAHRLPSPGSSSSDSLDAVTGGGGPESDSSSADGSSSDSDDSDSEVETLTGSIMKSTKTVHPQSSTGLPTPFGRPPIPQSNTPMRTGTFIPPSPSPYMNTAPPMGRPPSAMSRPPTYSVFNQTRMSYPYVPTVPAVGLGKQRPKLDLDPRTIAPSTPSLGFWRAPALGVNMGSGIGKPMSPPTAWGAPDNTPSCWGEWKAKVIQEQFVSQHRNVGVASERESRAERADAEI